MDSRRLPDGNATRIYWVNGTWSAKSASVRGRAGAKRIAKTLLRKFEKAAHGFRRSGLCASEPLSRKRRVSGAMAPREKSVIKISGIGIVVVARHTITKECSVAGGFRRLNVQLVSFKELVELIDIWKIAYGLPHSRATRKVNELQMTFAAERILLWKDKLRRRIFRQ